MPDVKRLAALFHAIGNRDWGSANAIAREVAAAEERVGHHSAARRLRGALTTNGASASTEEAPPTSVEFLTGALTPIGSLPGLERVRLRAAERAALEEVVVEWKNRAKLNQHGLAPRNKLLFHGPPGCGKSMAARALAGELGMPAYVVRFDSVVGAYLGQTALRLRQLFRFAETSASVLLLDEIDALGKSRGNQLDVGELDRIVIALLQELEHSRPAGLMIATSNLAAQLDQALWRRFDVAVAFPKPTQRELREYAVQLAAEKKLALSKSVLAAVVRAPSYAEVARVVDAEHRRAILQRA